jgi:hypothetical protein
MRAGDYWDQALTYHDYLARMTEKRDLHFARLQATSIEPDEPARFAGQHLRFLVLTEDYCTDSAQFIPPLARLAQELDNVELRVLLRDAHRDLASNYRRWDDYQAIPVIIVLDDTGNELGFLLERPRRTYDLLAAETRRFALEHPELPGINRTYANMPDETRAAVRANSERYRDKKQAEWTRFLFEDLAALVNAAVTKRDELAADERGHLVAPTNASTTQPT